MRYFMTNPTNKSFFDFFQPLKVGSEWHVMVTWPDGEVEPVTACRTEAEARHWIETQARKWLFNQFGIRRIVKRPSQ
jgi:hypothetical protein